MTTWRDFETLGQRDDIPFGSGSRGALMPGRSECNSSRSESTEETVRRLDSEFDQMLADMKPHVMRLPHKSGKTIFLT